MKIGERSILKRKMIGQAGFAVKGLILRPDAATGVDR